MTDVINEMRTDSDSFKRLKPADKWLARYTYENGDKHPSKEIISQLLKKYGNEDEVTIYRGINFDSAEHWNEFYSEFKNNEMTWTTGAVSSWTRTDRQAEQFARTKPSYQLNPWTIKAYDKAQQERETVSGYRGVIIQTTVRIGQAIDVDRSNLGHESEIVLPPGTWHVKIHRILKKFQHAFEEGDETIEKVFARMKKKDTVGESYLANLYKYILHHFHSQLTDEQKHKVFLWSKPDKMQIKVDAAPINKSPEAMQWDYEKKSHLFSHNVHVMFNYTLFYLAKEGLINDHDMQYVRNYAKKVLRQYELLVKEYPEGYFQLDGIEEIAHFAGREEAATALNAATIGKMYNHLNSREFIDKMHAEKDGDTLMRDMEDYHKLNFKQNRSFGRR